MKNLIKLIWFYRYWCISYKLWFKIIPEQNEPGPSPMGFSPSTNLTGQDLGKDPAVQKIFSWPKPSPKYCFFLFYTTKCTGDPSRPGLGPAQPKKIRPDLSSRTVMGGTFSARNNRGFFFGPAQPTKCLGPFEMDHNLEKKYIHLFLHPLERLTSKLSETCRFTLLHFPFLFFRLSQSIRQKSLGKCDTVSHTYEARVYIRHTTPEDAQAVFFSTKCPSCFFSAECPSWWVKKYDIKSTIKIVFNLQFFQPN